MIRSDDAGTGVCLFERLDVIDDPQPRTAPFNMAADEAVLDQLGDTPVLRIYRWLLPAISFGYFTSFRDVRRPEAPHVLIRRWTGGGIVEHGEDFTYSLIIPAGELRAPGVPRRLYELIHHALARALAVTGVETDPVCESSATPQRIAVGLRCFEHPVASDLMSEGRKTAGAAQRRTRRGLLHQGSVQGINPMGGHSPAGWRKQLALTLPEALCASPAARSLTPAEEREALRLAETKYGTPTWLERS